MKKIKIHKKVEEAGKEREDRWRELRMIMEKNEGADKNKIKLIQQENKLNEVDKVLKEIGLEKYSSLMRENGIDDLEILMEIQENHLEEIGIILGHRLKILKKIREIKEETKSPDPSRPKGILKTSATESSPARESCKKVTHSVSPQAFKPQPAKPSEKSNSKFISTAEIFASLESQKNLPLSKVPSKPDNKLVPKSVPPKSVFKAEPTQGQNSEKPAVASKTQETFTDSNDLHQSVSPSLKLVQTSSENSEKTLPKAGLSQNRLDFANPKEKEVVQLSRPPVSSKPATVAKNLALFQPTSQETEKNVKISELLTKPDETHKEDIKWEGFSYVPYKPSEEIQAISQKSNSRPASARSEAKTIEKTQDKERKAEKFDVAGWDN